MKIHLLSDLHRESFPVQFKATNADLLILAGDICGPQGCGIFDWADMHYPQTIYVPGNHEYYWSDMGKIRFPLPGSVQLLNPGVTKVGDVTFIGATLWSNFRDQPLSAALCKHFINDFRFIRGFTPAACKAIHANELDFIKTEVRNNPGKKVIVTHFMPLKELVHAKYNSTNDDITRNLNNYFANDLLEFTNTLEDTTWVYGHTHSSSDVTIGNVRFIANPKGYGEENPEYNPTLTFEI